MASRKILDKVSKVRTAIDLHRGIDNSDAKHKQSFKKDTPVAPANTIKKGKK